MGFLTAVKVEPILGRDAAILTAPLVFRDSRGRLFRIPQGFETDGASVPRLLRWVTPSKLQTLAAAIVHDWLYRTGRVPKREADRVFWEALFELEVEGWEAWLMWAGVAVGGWPAWWRYRRRFPR